jgi:hypothetical protein
MVAQEKYPGGECRLSSRAATEREKKGKKYLKPDMGAQPLRAIISTGRIWTEFVVGTTMASKFDTMSHRSEKKNYVQSE